MEKMVKVNELKQGDVIRTEIYSTLWNRTVATTGTVLSVDEIGGNCRITLKVRDGFKEMIVDRFAANGTEYEAA